MTCHARGVQQACKGVLNERLEHVSILINFTFVRGIPFLFEGQLLQ